MLKKFFLVLIIFLNARPKFLHVYANLVFQNKIGGELVPSKLLVSLPLNDPFHDCLEMRIYNDNIKLDGIQFGLGHIITLMIYRLYMLVRNITVDFDTRYQCGLDTRIINLG